MAENKTRPTDLSVHSFLHSVEHPTRRRDGLALLAMMEEITGEPAVLWGSSIVGFGNMHYRYESGREGEMPLVGFAPRKQSLSLYIIAEAERDQYADLLAALGKHKLSKACLYINKLADVDAAVLRRLIERAYRLAYARAAA